MVEERENEEWQQNAMAIAYLQSNTDKEIEYPAYADRQGLVHAQAVEAHAKRWARANMDASTFSAQEVNDFFQQDGSSFGEMITSRGWPPGNLLNNIEEVPPLDGYDAHAYRAVIFTAVWEEVIGMLTNRIRLEFEQASQNNKQN